MQTIWITIKLVALVSLRSTERLSGINTTRLVWQFKSIIGTINVHETPEQILRTTRCTYICSLVLTHSVPSTISVLPAGQRASHRSRCLWTSAVWPPRIREIPRPRPEANIRSVADRRQIHKRLRPLGPQEVAKTRNAPKQGKGGFKTEPIQITMSHWKNENWPHCTSSLNTGREEAESGTDLKLYIRAESG